MKVINSNSRRRAPDTIFILLLLCVFAFTSLLLVIFGANAYTRISQQKELHFQRNTPLSYIAAKVRQSDGVSAVRTEEIDGTTALVISSLDGDELCETWIYEYGGSLRELYISAGTPFSLSDGTALLTAYGLSFTLESGRLQLCALDQNGAKAELSLTLRGTLPGGERLE